MRVLVVVIPEKGHTNPYFGVVRRLCARAHDVAVAAFAVDDEIAAAFRALPITSLALSSPSAAAAVPERVTRGREFAERLRDRAWLSSWVEQLLVDAAPSQVAPLSACIDRVRPDVVVADPMLYAAAVACAQAKVAWAAVSTSLNPVTPRHWRTDLTDTLGRIDAKRHAFFADNGIGDVRFRVSDVESPWLNVAFTSAEYAAAAADGDDAADDDDDKDDRVHLVGKPFDDDDRALRDGETITTLDRRPRLYASFGSQAFHQPDLFAKVFAAAHDLSLHVVASCGDLVDDREFVRAAPKDAVLLRSAPQLLVLPHVDVVVSHGGANSVVESLAHAKPLVLLPLCNDQPLQARFLDAAGAGAVVADPASADGATIARAIRAALSDDVRARVERIAASLSAAGGPSRCATLIEELAAKRVPL